VTAAEAGPEGTDESEPARIEAGALRPPQLEIRRAQDGALTIRVAAGRALGSVVFASPAGDEIARIALPRTPSPARQVLDVTLPADRVRGEILVAHELPDGARSAWRPYRVPPVPPAGDPELSACALDHREDPHECPRRQPSARVQKSHFLSTGGSVVDVCSGQTCLAPLP
jgi:hypothetical protein